MPQVRDPAAGVFSAETMLRNMGVPLSWTLTEPLQGAATDSGETADPRFQVQCGGSRVGTSTTTVQLLCNS